MAVDRTENRKLSFTGDLDRVEWLTLLNFVAKFRERFSDLSRSRREDLDCEAVIEVKFAIEINAADPFFLDIKRVNVDLLKLDSRQLAGRQLDARLSIGSFLRFARNICSTAAGQQEAGRDEDNDAERLEP